MCTQEARGVEAEIREKRRRNVRAALERIIEHVGEVDVTAQAVLAAVQAYAKINAQGQWIDRTEQVNLNELFERMTQEELEVYARDGQLPVWFTQTVVATPKDNQEVKNDTRAAARMLLKQKERVEERKTNRPPDVRMVVDLPRYSIEVVSASERGATEWTATSTSRKPWR